MLLNSITILFSPLQGLLHDVDAIFSTAILLGISKSLYPLWLYFVCRNCGATPGCLELLQLYAHPSAQACSRIVLESNLKPSAVKKTVICWVYRARNWVHHDWCRSEYNRRWAYKKIIT